MPKISAAPPPPSRPSLTAGHVAQLGEGLVGLEHVATGDSEEQDHDRGAGGEHAADDPARRTRESARRHPCAGSASGPPDTVPSAWSSRYFTPRVHSTNFVHIPSSPATIIQKVAPAPPMVTATPTPAMLPSPTVPDTAELSAWK